MWHSTHVQMVEQQFFYLFIFSLLGLNSLALLSGLGFAIVLTSFYPEPFSLGLVCLIALFCSSFSTLVPLWESLLFPDVGLFAAVSYSCSLGVQRGNRRLAQTGRGGIHSACQCGLDLVDVHQNAEFWVPQTNDVDSPGTSILPSTLQGSTTFQSLRTIALENVSKGSPNYKKLSGVLFSRPVSLRSKISLFVPETTTKTQTQGKFQDIFFLMTSVFPFSQLSVG